MSPLQINTGGFHILFTEATICSSGCFHFGFPYTRCMTAALAPVQSQGTKVLLYLDDWLICSPSHTQAAQDILCLPSHVAQLGLKISLVKNYLNPSQTTIFIGTALDTTTMTARLSPYIVENILHLLPHFQGAGECLYIAEGEEGLSPIRRTRWANQNRLAQQGPELPGHILQLPQAFGGQINFCFLLLLWWPCPPFIRHMKQVRALCPLVRGATLPELFPYHAVTHYGRGTSGGILYVLLPYVPIRPCIFSWVPRVSVATTHPLGVVLLPESSESAWWGMY